MNRREFIKKAFGLAVCTTIPATIIKNIPKHNYTLGKGSLYWIKDGIEVKVPVCSFNFTLDQIDPERLARAFKLEKEIGEEQWMKINFQKD